MTIAPEPSHLRATPVQTRSAKTFDLILSAGASLLVEEGLPGFNTNAVAKAAGINVATLYHYFPHKNAILREMADRYDAELAPYARAQLAALTLAGDLDAWLRGAVGELYQLRQRQPGVAALGHALNAVPELSEARTGHGDAWALALASALTQRLPGLDPSRARTVALVMIETATSLLDLAGQRPEAASEILEELVVLLGGYFAVLGDKGSHGPGAPSL